MPVAVFVFGIVVGSFLNVVLLRKNTGESIVKGRSRCFSCGKKLAWFELVPIASFIVQLGKCRQCGSKISWQYPIIEAVTGFLAIAVFLMTQTKFGSFGFYFFAFCALFLIAAYDFKHKIIDKNFLHIFGGFSVIEFIFKHLNISTTISATAIFLFFYFFWRISSGKWMGRGDADLAFFLALFLGYPLNLFMFLGSFWVGAVVGITLLIVRPGNITIKSEVPFGPFLAFSSFFIWYFDKVLITFYEFLYF